MVDIIRNIAVIAGILIGGVLLLCIIGLIKQGIDALRERVDNEAAERYLDELDAAIDWAVQAVNQTYVDELKASGRFDAEAHAEAFKRAVAYVKETLSSECLSYVSAAFTSLTEALTPRIEAAVSWHKK